MPCDNRAMLFDTDILIWVQRGNEKAARLIERHDGKYLSAQSYMELMQGSRNQAEHRVLRQFIQDFEFTILPLSENIGHRAMIYVEQFALSSGMRAGDALIAATAIENNLTLVSSNAKHFKAVDDLELKVFRP